MKSLVELITRKYWVLCSNPPIGSYIAIYPKNKYCTVYRVLGNVINEYFEARAVAHHNARRADPITKLSADEVYLIDPNDLPGFLK